MKRARALYIAVPRWAVDAIIAGKIDGHLLSVLIELAKDADVLVEKRVAQRRRREDAVRIAEAKGPVPRS